MKQEGDVINATFSHPCTVLPDSVCLSRYLPVSLSLTVEIIFDQLDSKNGTKLDVYKFPTFPSTVGYRPDTNRPESAKDIRMPNIRSKSFCPKSETPPRTALHTVKTKFD